ncbi:MAG: hypothetical protein ACRCWM_07835 [Sarcina sp.]
MKYEIIFCFGLGITGISLVAMIFTFFKCNVKEIIYDLIGKKTNTKVKSRKDNYKIKDVNQGVQIRASKSNVGETHKTATIRKNQEFKEEQVKKNFDLSKNVFNMEVRERATGILDEENTGVLVEAFEESTGLLDIPEDKERYTQDDEITGLLEENVEEKISNNIIYRDNFEGINQSDMRVTDVLDEYKSEEDENTGLLCEDDEVTGLMNEDEDCTGLLDEDCTGLMDDDENWIGIVEEKVKERNILIIHSDIEI